MHNIIVLVAIITGRRLIKNLQFNVVLFHIGKYNNPNLELFIKCFNSIKNEFQNDNILVFHSYEEVFQKYPQVNNFIKKVEDFWNSIQIEYKIDLLRLILTLYISNMVYFDSDICVLPGLRREIEENVIQNNYDFYIDEVPHLGYFYSNKKSVKILQHFFKQFRLGIYEGDIKAFETDDFYLKNFIKRKQYHNLIHYGALRFFNQIKNAYVVESLDDENLIPQNAIVLCNDRVYAKLDKWTIYYWLVADITYKDILQAGNNSLIKDIHFLKKF